MVSLTATGAAFTGSFGAGTSSSLDEVSVAMIAVEIKRSRNVVGFCCCQVCAIIDHFTNELTF